MNSDSVNEVLKNLILYADFQIKRVKKRCFILVSILFIIFLILFIIIVYNL